MRDLIVFGEDFGGLPSSTQHLITRLSQQRKVLWVNSIGLRQPKFNLHDLKRALNKLMGKSNSGYNVDSDQRENITVVNIKTIPAPSSSVARQIAKAMICAQLKPLIAKLGLKKPILWSSLPTTADLCGDLGESAVVYYCGDDFSSLAGVDHHVVAKHEHKLVEQADLVLTASNKLLNKFPQSKTLYLPHGVDTELFSTPCPRANDLPPVGNKVAGFYGSLSSWLDYDLIDQVCRANPEWQFVFIGPIELPTNPLPNLDNVHYLGPKPHSALPSYSQHWQASLLPFKSNRQIEACSPLKLLEYLAAGSKVIATPFPALMPYKKHVAVVENCQQLSQALNAIDCSNRSERLNRVASESWDNRSLLVERMLESL